MEAFRRNASIGSSEPFRNSALRIPNSAVLQGDFVNFGDRKIILAPLAGITDTIFRAMCRAQGADIVVSEMVSSEGVTHGAKNTTELTRFDEGERPIGVQIFGARPESMAAAAAWIEEHARPDFIDLNSGCPVPKVVGGNGGSSLLKDARLFESIVTAMVRAVKIPVTVKIRCGWTLGDWVDTQFARIAQECGATAVALHARTRSMGFSGQAIWERIALVKQAVSIPVIGNGDITSGERAVRMFAETGCDSIMVGRAAMGNPWIFREIKAALTGASIPPVTWEERREAACTHVRHYAQLYGELRAAAEMKKHVAWYIKGFPGAAIARDRVFRAQSTAELIDGINSVDTSGREASSSSRVCRATTPSTSSSWPHPSTTRRTAAPNSCATDLTLLSARKTSKRPTSPTSARQSLRARPAR